MDGRHDARDDADAVHPREYVLPRLVLANSAVIDFALVAHCVTLLNDTVAGLSRRRRRGRSCVPRAYGPRARGATSPLRLVSRLCAQVARGAARSAPLPRALEARSCGWYGDKTERPSKMQKSAPGSGTRNRPVGPSAAPSSAGRGARRSPRVGRATQTRRESFPCPVSAVTPPQIGPKVWGLPQVVALEVQSCT